MIDLAKTERELIDDTIIGGVYRDTIFLRLWEENKRSSNPRTIEDIKMEANSMDDSYAHIIEKIAAY